MEQLFIRNLDHSVLTQLKRRAWEQGLPLDEFLRRIILASVCTEEPTPKAMPLHTPAMRGKDDGAALLGLPPRMRDSAGGAAHRTMHCL